MTRIDHAKLARMTPAQVLRHHVTGAIERGEGVAIVEQRTPVSATQWGPMVDDCQYRIGERSPGRVMCLWRKEHNPAFYGGYQIKTIPVGTRIADEWLKHAES